MYERNEMSDRTVQMPMYPKSLLSSQTVPSASFMTSSLHQAMTSSEAQRPKMQQTPERGYGSSGAPSPGPRSSGPRASDQREASAASTGGGGLRVKDGSKKAAELKKIPCKFFKNAACSAGSACPFSHNLNARDGLSSEREGGPMQSSKAVCEYFQKGSCKFGGKCALAHIYPGQSMGMDRKNKRAAAAAAAAQKSEEALRSFQDIARRDFDRDFERGFHDEDIGLLNRGESHSFDPRLSATDPNVPHRYRVLAGSPGRNGHHQYRYDIPEDFSEGPHARNGPLTLDRQASHLGSRARPTTIQASPSKFESGALSTSPFSPPGRKSLFFSTPSETTPAPRNHRRLNDPADIPERNDDPEHARPDVYAISEKDTWSASASSGGLTGGPDHRLTRSLAVPQRSMHHDLNESTHEEDFLPGSLTELLTPRELERRQARQDPYRGGRRITSEQENMPYAVGYHLEIDREQSSRAKFESNGLHLGTMSGPPALEVEDFMRRDWQQRQRQSAEAHNASWAWPSNAVEHSDSSLSAQLRMPTMGNSRVEELHVPHQMDRSAAALLRSPWLAPIPAASEAQSPTRLALLDSHLPGQSLPQGLGAGLSRLHLGPAGDMSSFDATTPRTPFADGSARASTSIDTQNAQGLPGYKPAHENGDYHPSDKAGSSNLHGVRDSPTAWRPWMTFTAGSDGRFHHHLGPSPAAKGNESGDYTAGNGSQLKTAPLNLSASPGSRISTRPNHRGSPLAQRHFLTAAENDRDPLQASPDLAPTHASRLAPRELKDSRSSALRPDQGYDEDETQFALDLDSG